MTAAEAAAITVMAVAGEQINTRAFPPRQQMGSQLLFVPVTPRRRWISTDRPDSHGAVHRNAMVYPCSGRLAEPGGRACWCLWTAR